LHNLVSAFITLFVVLDPIGLGPIFLGVTQDMPEPVRRKVGRDASVIAFGVLAGSALFGDWLLRALGIGLEAFRIAGGLLLFVIAFEMVFEKRTERKSGDTELQGRANVAAFPLASPLMAGPGAITACVLLAGRTEGNWLEMSLLIAIIAVLLAICFLIFLISGTLKRLLGPRGLIIAGRLLGVLLAAMAVQFVADGVLALARH
jgi:multiple antibiotic resistance protein